MEDGGPAGCDRVTPSRSGRAERSLISVDLPRKDRSITSLPPIQTPSTNKHADLLLIDTVDRGAIRRSFSLTCTRFQVKYLSQLFPKMLQYPTEPTNHPSPVCRKLLTAKECVDQCQPFGRLVEGHQVACTPDRHHAHAVVLHEPPGNLFVKVPGLPLGLDRQVECFHTVPGANDRNPTICVTTVEPNSEPCFDELRIYW